MYVYVNISIYIYAYIHTYIYVYQYICVQHKTTVGQVRPGDAGEALCPSRRRAPPSGDGDRRAARSPQPDPAHIHICIYIYNHMYIYLSIYLTIYLSIYLSIYLYVFTCMILKTAGLARPGGEASPPRRGSIPRCQWGPQSCQNAPRHRYRGTSLIRNTHPNGTTIGPQASACCRVLRGGLFLKNEVPL